MTKKLIFIAVVLVLMVAAGVTLLGNDGYKSLNGPYAQYQANGYAIDIPESWEDIPDFAKFSSDSSSKWWGYSEEKIALNINWSNTTEPNEIVRNDWGSALDNVRVKPNEYSLSHPEVPRATVVDLIEFHSNDPVPQYEIYLFVRGEGENRYEIRGRLVNASPQEIETLRRIALSFELTD